MQVYEINGKNRLLVIIIGIITIIIVYFIYLKSSKIKYKYIHTDAVFGKIEIARWTFLDTFESISKDKQSKISINTL